MPPQSRGGSGKAFPNPVGLHSQSTPNLPALRTLPADTEPRPGPRTAYPAASILHPSNDGIGSPEIITSPSEPASVDDYSLDSSHDPPSLSPASSSSSASEEDDGPVPNLPPRPIYHHHSRSHPYLPPSAFAPPFYNRPPTPLPPSPSLTSLLRPTFSSANSRPNTPDPSSDEGSTPHTHHASTTTTTNNNNTTNGAHTPNSTATTLTRTLRAAKNPPPRASPPVPTYEYYGFTLYLTSSLAFVVYCLWAFLPSPFLHSLGIYYFPDRWWALAIPAWTVMLIVYVYVALAAYNIEYLTLPLNSVECLVDEAANVAVVDAEGRIVRDERPSWQQHAEEVGRRVGKKGGSDRARKVHCPDALDWRRLWNEGTDAVMDIPIGGVCEILYGYDDGS